MNPLRTHAFSFGTTASPEAVWRALTDGDHGVQYLHGLTLASDWTPGSAVEARVVGCDGKGPRLQGTVLIADASNRLSYTFDHGLGDSATYVTWQVRATDGGGSVVGLLVDEMDGLTPEEAEDVWLPVLGRVQAAVAAPTGEAWGSPGPGQGPRA